MSITTKDLVIESLFSTSQDKIRNLDLLALNYGQKCPFQNENQFTKTSNEILPRKASVPLI